MIRPTIVFGRGLAVGLALSLYATAGPAAAQEDESPAVAEQDAGPPIMEGMPDWYVQLAQDEQKAYLDDLGENRDLAAVTSGLVILKSARWPVGSTIRVGFFGGSPRLHALIERLVAEWSVYANIKFDFGRDASGHYRTWDPKSQDNHQSQVRVAFDNPGYWSMVGTQALDPKLRQANRPTLNLQGFDKQLPFIFIRPARHEFGHALGLEHEHQHPLSACDFRWEDEPGYQPTHDANGTFVPDAQGRHPGVYTYMGGPPNKWTREQTAFNLRPITEVDKAPVSAYGFGPIDKFSIMKYDYLPWLFISGTKSPCWAPHLNNDLSDEDKRRIAEFYPKNVGAAAAQNEKMRDSINAVVGQLPKSSLLAQALVRRAQELR